MRATRDLLRRRMHRMRKRAALLAPIQHPNSQYHLPESSKKLAYTANRAGVAERFPEPAVQQSLAVDRALIDSDDRLLTDVERSLVNPAKTHDAQTFYRLRSIPGVGKIRSLVLLYESHDLHRFPRGQEFVSYGRLVKCAQASAGKRDGTAGKKMGHADLKWAFSEAAVLCLRKNPAAQKYLTRIAKKHGQGKALTVLAQK
jgi:transposase